MGTHMPPSPEHIDARYWWYIKEVKFAEGATAREQLDAKDELKKVHPWVIEICRKTRRRFITRTEHRWVFHRVWDEYINWYTVQTGDWEYNGFQKAALQSPNTFQWGISQYSRADHSDIAITETAFWWGHQQEMALWLAAYHRNTDSPNVLWECRFCGEWRETEDLEHFLVCDKEECLALAILDGDIVTEKGVDV